MSNNDDDGYSWASGEDILTGPRHEELRFDDDGNRLEGTALTNETAAFLYDRVPMCTVADTGRLYVYHGGVWRRNGEHLLRNRVQRLLGRDASHQRATQVIRALERRNPVNRSHLSPPEGMIPVDNGVIDVEEERVRDHSPDLAGRWKLPVPFDADAQAPLWKECLDEWVSDEDQTTLQEFAGYCLHHWGTPYERALLLVGSGANGKSTFLETLRKLFGDTSAAASLGALTGNRFATSDLDGATVNIHPDLTSTDLEEPDRFKALVSGDTIRAEEKYEDGYEFENRAKMLFAANRTPRVPEVGRAFYRRWLIVPFLNEFPEGSDRSDPRLEDKLEEELPGILKWALVGLKRLLEQDGFTHAPSPDDVEETWKRWQEPQDIVDKFVEEHCTLSPQEHVTKDFLQRCLEQYGEERGAVVPDKSVVSRKLQDRYEVTASRPRRNSGRVPVYDGITVTATTEEGGRSPADVVDEFF